MRRFTPSPMPGLEPPLDRRVTADEYAAVCSWAELSGIKAGYFVGFAGEGGQTHSARWLEARHGDRIAVRAHDATSVRELVANGAGLSIFPCFIGDSDPRLVRVAPPIPELRTDQWLVSHHEERHDPAVRTVADRIAVLMRDNGALFRGETPRQG